MKKPIIKFWGENREGKFGLYKRERDNFVLHNRNLPDGKYYLTIKKEYGRRTNQQNAYYWVLMTILGNELGLSKEQAHEMCKIIFLSETAYGSPIPLPKSTASLDKWEFVQYVDELRQWAATSYINPEDENSLDKAVFLPDPTRIEFDDVN